MKRVIALVMMLCVFLACAGCGKDKADIPLEKLSWSLNEGENAGHSYIYFKMTNNADIPILSFQMSFRIKDSASNEQREQFIQALQESQGFDDAFMQNFLKNLQDNGGEMLLTARSSAPLQPGDTTDPLQCYYMGGWTSKDLIFPELFEPAQWYIVYEKDGAQWGQSYDFTTKAYSLNPVTEEQQ